MDPARSRRSRDRAAGKALLSGCRSSCAAAWGRLAWPLRHSCGCVGVREGQYALVSWLTAPETASPGPAPVRDVQRQVLGLAAGASIPQRGRGGCCAGHGIAAAAAPASA